MKSNWKESLISEIDNYSLMVENFKEKWCCDDKIEKLVIGLKERAKKANKERNVMFDKAISYYNQKLSADYGETNKYHLNRQIKSLKKEKSNPQYNILTNYLNDDEKPIIASYVKDYVTCAINSLEDKLYKEFPQLVQIVAILGLSNKTLRITLNTNQILGNTFSQYCIESFKSFVNIKRNNEDLFDKVIDTNLPIVKIGDSKFGGYQIMDNAAEISNCYYFLKEEFLNNLIETLKSNKFSSLIDFCSYMAKSLHYTLPTELLDLKALYEATHEEIMVEDQKYYGEKQLQEIKNQAEKDRLQRKYYEEQQLRLQEEQQEAAERRQRELDRHNQALEHYTQESNNSAAKATFDSQITILQSELLSLEINDPRAPVLRMKLDALRRERNKLK